MVKMQQASDDALPEDKLGEQSSDHKSERLMAKGISNYFLGFWDARHASEALKYLEFLEMKNYLRSQQKVYGCWRPSPEVAEALKKPATKLSNFSSRFPDNKDARNLKFVLKVLGCSVRENRPYKQFLKAQAVRQKRYWLYKYQGPVLPEKVGYNEPICPTRLKRLYHFFPDRFRQEDDNIYFNNQLLTYDEARRVFYIGGSPDDDDE